MLGTPDESRCESYNDFVEEQRDLIESSYALARKNLGVAASRAKNRYDHRVRQKIYNTGEWVWYFCPRRYANRSPKLEKMYTGPFLILDVLNPVNLRIQKSRRSKPFIVHIDKVKRFYGDAPESWIVDNNQLIRVEPQLPELPIIVSQSSQRDVSDDVTNDVIENDDNDDRRRGQSKEVNDSIETDVENDNNVNEDNIIHPLDDIQPNAADSESQHGRRPKRNVRLPVRYMD